MRYLILLAAAGLFACDREPDDAGPQQARVMPAALSFDGSGTPDVGRQRVHGDRLASVLGCRGCHGKQLTGKNFTEDEPDYGVFYASNLTRAMPRYSDAQFEQLMREGRHRERSELWIMPSEVFQFLADEDVAALLAYLRSLPPEGSVSPAPVLGPTARSEIASGKTKTTAQLVREWKSVPLADYGPDHALGRYVTSVTCTECHGPALEGHDGDTPNLDIAGAYTHAELETLLTTGKGKTPRDLGLMTIVGLHRFSKLTPRERTAVVAYVKARAARSQ